MPSISNLRLALIAHRFAPNDGMGRVNYELARAALDRGAHVSLLCGHCSEELISHPNATIVFLGNESLPTQLLRNVAYANATAKWLKQHRGEFDLVQANGSGTWAQCDVVSAHFVHTSWAKNEFYPFRSSSKPSALYQRLYTQLNARWEREAYVNATKVIAVSEVVRQDLVDLGIPANKVEVIYNGVDTVEFAPGPSERASFGLPETYLLALFVGDIKSPRKNLSTLLTALVNVPDMHLAVAGETKGSSAPELAEKLGIAARVHFVGKTKRVGALMRSCDLFVFPSRYEAHPLVVLEAMASALPIILSKSVGSVGSFREYVSVLEDPDDARSLAALMNELAASPERRMQMGANSRQRALGLGWAQTTEAYFRVFESVVHERSPVTVPGRS